MLENTGLFYTFVFFIAGINDCRYRLHIQQALQVGLFRGEPTLWYLFIWHFVPPYVCSGNGQVCKSANRRVGESAKERKSEAAIGLWELSVPVV